MSGDGGAGAALRRGRAGAAADQLRGRVGRGGFAGLALFVTEAPSQSLARERVDAVASTTDVFTEVTVAFVVRSFWYFLTVSVQ